jgi:hypothetical protein
MAKPQDTFFCPSCKFFTLLVEQLWMTSFTVSHCKDSHFSRENQTARQVFFSKLQKKIFTSTCIFLLCALDFSCFFRIFAVRKEDALNTASPSRMGIKKWLDLLGQATLCFGGVALR